MNAPMQYPTTTLNLDIGRRELLSISKFSRELLIE